jgi:hypothetical protein
MCEWNRGQRMPTKKEVNIKECEMSARDFSPLFLLNLVCSLHSIYCALGSSWKMLDKQQTFREAIDPLVVEVLVENDGVTVDGTLHLSVLLLLHWVLQGAPYPHTVWYHCTSPMKEDEKGYERKQLRINKWERIGRSGENEEESDEQSIRWTLPSLFTTITLITPSLSSTNSNVKIPTPIVFECIYSR